MYVSPRFLRWVLFGMVGVRCFVSPERACGQSWYLYIWLTNISTCTLGNDKWGYSYHDAYKNNSGGMNPPSQGTWGAFNGRSGGYKLISGSASVGGNPGYPITLTVWQNFTLANGSTVWAAVFNGDVVGGDGTWHTPWIKVCSTDCQNFEKFYTTYSRCFTNTTGSTVYYGGQMLKPNDWTCQTQQRDICYELYRKFGYYPTNMDCGQMNTDQGQVIKISDWNVDANGNMTNAGAEYDLTLGTAGTNTQYGIIMPSTADGYRMTTNWGNGIQGLVSAVSYGFQMTNAQGLQSLWGTNLARDSTFVSVGNLLHGDNEKILAALSRSNSGGGGTVQVTNSDGGLLDWIKGVWGDMSVSNLVGAVLGSNGPLCSAASAAASVQTNMAMTLLGNSGIGAKLWESTNNSLDTIAGSETYPSYSLGTLGGVEAVLDPAAEEFSQLRWARVCFMIAAWGAFYFWLYNEVRGRVIAMFSVPQVRTAGGQYAGFSASAPSAVVVAGILIVVLLGAAGLMWDYMLSVSGPLWIAVGGWLGGSVGGVTIPGWSAAMQTCWGFICLCLPVSTICAVLSMWLTVRASLDFWTLVAMTITKVLVGI